MDPARAGLNRPAAAPSGGPRREAKAAADAKAATFLKGKSEQQLLEEMVAK